MSKRMMFAAAAFGLAALSLPTAAFASFRNYPAIYCAQLDDSAYTDPNNTLRVDYAFTGRGTATFTGNPTSSVSIICPIFNDDHLNVRTHTPIHTYVSSSSGMASQVAANACVTWAGGNGHCGTLYVSNSTGSFEIVDEGAYTGTHSTSANDTFFLLVRLTGESAGLVSYYFNY